LAFLGIFPPKALTPGEGEEIEFNDCGERNWYDIYGTITENNLKIFNTNVFSNMF
jgi:hypothetical protein